MFDTICTLPLSSELFAQAIHPREPILAVGLSAGHVQSFRLPPIGKSGSGEEEQEDKSNSLRGRGEIATEWRTRRHKGSCRTLSFSLDGEALYSAGTDGLVKAASAETGQVISKLAIPLDPSTEGIDAPSLLHVLSPQCLLLGTDSSALHVYDVRADHGFKSLKPQATYYPHDDYISSLTPLPPSDASTSGFSKQWVSTGGTTLAVTDLRRGVLVRSDDQEEELLSSLHVGGLSKRGTNTGEKVLVGGAGGVITLWERGVWDDQDERIVLDRAMFGGGTSAGGGGGDSVDCLARVPVGVGPGAVSRSMVAAGLGSGLIACVQLAPNRLVDVLRHDEVEAVVEIGFDVGNRMISGGGQVIKVWQQPLEQEVDEDEESEEQEEEGNKEEEEDDDDDDVVAADGIDKRPLDSDDESDDDSGEDGKTERRRKKKKKKKRRRGSQSNGASQPPSMGLFKGLD